MLLLLTFAWLTSFSFLPQASPPECSTRDTCRAQALIAEAAGDFERFHDLAWRAMQKGKPNDPELMVMLARAMALSGRPGDAIVMLSRLADMHVKVDTSGDEFRVARTLKDWPDVEAKLAALNGPVVSDAAPPMTSSAPPKPPPPVSAAPEPRAPEPRAPEATKPDAPKAADEPEFSFSAPSTDISGLAYDAVSRRFVMGDRRGGGLVVADEVSHRVVPLVSTAGAGFYDTVTAFRIDPRRGDLWVVSTRQDGDHAHSVLHKLQLVSGRPIFELEARSFGDVRLVDVAVDQSGTVYALDAADSRVFRVRPGSRTLELVTRTSVDAPTAFDVVDDRTAYVAGSAGITRLDLTTGRGTLLKAKPALGRIAAIDARGPAILIIQQSSDGEHLVRCKLDRAGRAIASTQVVDSAMAIARTGDRLYYVAAPGVIRALREKP